MWMLQSTAQKKKGRAEEVSVSWEGFTPEQSLLYVTKAWADTEYNQSKGIEIIYL